MERFQKNHMQSDIFGSVDTQLRYVGYFQSAFYVIKRYFKK
jgi:hypothetical protein